MAAGPDLFGAFGGSMGHDWVYEVLADLRVYAMANGLPALAVKADEALQVAKAEIAAQQARQGPKGRGN